MRKKAIACQSKLPVTFVKGKMESKGWVWECASAWTGLSTLHILLSLIDDKCITTMRLLLLFTVLLVGIGNDPDLLQN